VNPFALDGRVALVTGGGRGLGRGMASALARAGATVAVSSRSKDELDDAVADISNDGGTATAHPLDIGEPDAPRELVADVLREHGRLDVVVHAAGNIVRKPSLEMSADEWDSLQRVHLRAAFLLAQAAGTHMVAQGSGSIVFIASLTSERLGMPNVVAYGAAKSGLLGLNRTLAVEWAPHGVRVNAIAVGWFPTALNKDVPQTPERLALTVGRVPMGRLGDPDEDLGGPVVFLASDASAYVTGAVLYVDGGWSVA
jgi:2-dehydro-3-deoxy-D-gluconate 5-dehydrogenase